jgi:RNA polymerase sigma-70 factor (ECF subfamily)
MAGKEDAAFNAMFEANYDAVLAFAVRRIQRADVADDVVAETFSIAWRRRDSLPDPARPWLLGVARNVIANEHRANRRRRALVERIEGSTDGAASGENPADEVAERMVISNAFARLTEREREVLMLVAWDRLSSADAARVLGCTAVAFRVRLHRARRLLEQYLDEAAESQQGSEKLVVREGEVGCASE